MLYYHLSHFHGSNGLSWMIFTGRFSWGSKQMVGDTGIIWKFDWARHPIQWSVHAGCHMGAPLELLTRASPHGKDSCLENPWTEEPGRLQSMGSLRVRHDWVTSLSLFTFMHWRRKWQPTPVFLPGESQGWGSLVGCRLWSRTELDTTEVT